MAPLSTAQVARTVGIHPVTLERWLAAGRFKTRKTMRIGAKVYRVWTEKDIERLKTYKERSYRKGRGRKKKAL